MEEMTTQDQKLAKNDIVVVASCNVDLISYVDKIPKLGETLAGNEFKMGFGGKGANKAIACARLGSSVSIIAKLGDDVFGKDYLDNFKQNRIETKHVKITNEAATGVAPICVDKTGANSIIVILGANLLLNRIDIDSSVNLIKDSNILITNLEIPVDVAYYSLKLAKLNKKITILNFAPAISSDQLDEFKNDEKKVDNERRDLFEYVDYLILNEVEVEQLSQVIVNNVIEDAKKASLSLLEKYSVNVGVIVTLGAEGVIFTGRQDQQQASSIHVKGEKVKVVDTTGAGDAFVGSFAHYLNKYGGQSIQNVLQLAVDYAGITVQSPGTQTSYPSIDKLESKFH